MEKTEKLNVGTEETIRGQIRQRERCYFAVKLLAFSSADIIDFIFPLASFALICRSSCSLAA